MNSLELESDDDLIAELARRYPHFVIAGMVKFTDESAAQGSQVAELCRFQGNALVCLGLTNRIQSLINGTINESMEIEDP